MITRESEELRIIRRIGRFIAGRLPHIPLPVLRGPLRGTWFILGSLAGLGGEPVSISIR